jgi:hypothetical protein
MLGKYFLAAVVSAAVIIIGMLFYPTVHFNYDGIDVSSFIPIVQAGMVILSYGFIFFVAYLVIAHIRK